MNKTLLTLFISLIITGAKAQIPPYTATVYDTTVTGYYFTSPSITLFNYAHLILDAKGRIVYYKLFPTQTVDFKMQPNGLISYCWGQKWYIMDSTFYIRDTILAGNGLTTNIHDLLILPNGHYLLLANENVTMNLQAYHYFNDNGSPGSAFATVKCNVIQELDENKNVVFEWHLKDHMNFDSVDTFWCYSPTTVDWCHSNAIVKDNDGNYLLSSRHFNEITKINATTGDIMWRFGGNYNQFTYIGDTVPFYGQHDVRRLSNGNISLFDNGNHTIPHPARALEYHLDETNLTAELVWSYIYDSSMHSNAMGNVQDLPNSNRLIDYGDFEAGHNVTFNVVRQDQSKVFELAFRDTMWSYRSYYYPTLPWGFNRPTIACFDSAGSHYLDAGNYSAYSWSTGASTRTIEITTADTFMVFVPYGQNGVISSEEFIVTDVTNPCGITSITERSHGESISLFPTIATDYLTVLFPKEIHDNIVIRDVAGRIVKQEDNKRGSAQLTLDITSLSGGMYFLSAGNKSLRFIKEK